MAIDTDALHNRPALRAWEAMIDDGTALTDPTRFATVCAAMEAEQRAAMAAHATAPDLEPVTAEAPFPTLSTVQEDAPTPRPNRFPAVWGVVVVLVALVSLAINVGPGVGALVDYATHHAATTTVAAPSAPLTSPVSLEEDSPGWDCRTMGNRWCGEGVVGGPLVDVDSGWVSCPRGGDLLDATTGDVPPGVTPPGLVCRYGTAGGA